MPQNQPIPKIIPLILSGGAGTRLWPVSREEMPKQFLNFTGEQSLLQETLKRCQGASFAERPIIVALAAQADIITQQASALNVEADVILEPARRDSCAAVLAGACHALTRDPDAMVLILAADHHIDDPEAFRAAVASAASAAAKGNIVTFGVKPTFPATGYGYVLPGEPIAGTSCSVLARFREKPAREIAQSYIAEGCLWNSGNFLVKASVLADHARRFVPQIWNAIESSIANAARENSVIRPDRESYERADRISFDYAIMEKTQAAAVQPVHYAWSDIGTWDSVAKSLSSDSTGNSIKGPAVIVGGTNNLVFSTGPVTVVQGLDDVIVVATPDAVLVARRGDSEKVKLLAEELSKRGLKLEVSGAGVASVKERRHV